MALVAQPGVLARWPTRERPLLVLLVGPPAALVALQAALIVSSRVNDARTAQQFGVLIIVPLTGVLVAQFTGAFWLTAGSLALVAAGCWGSGPRWRWSASPSSGVRAFSRGGDKASGILSDISTLNHPNI